MLKNNWKKILNSQSSKELLKTYREVCRRLDNNPDDEKLYKVRDYIHHILSARGKDELGGDKICFRELHNISRELEHEDWLKWRKENSRRKIKQFYEDFINELENQIREEEEFGKYIEKEFLFEPKLLREHKETSREYRLTLESYIRDLRGRSYTRNKKQDRNTEVSDWFMRVRRDNMGTS